MAGSLLCVDADRNLCQILSRVLETEGYEVVTAHDGEQALARVMESPPDLLLMDLILPRRDGFSVLEAIRALPGAISQLPVVLLCGCMPSPEYNRRARALDAAALLTKPVPLEKLVAVVAGQVGEAKAPVPVSPPASKGVRRPRERELSGRLASFSFPALLHHLHGLRASGVLRLEAAPKRKAVQLRDGYPTAVRSNLLNECLGNYLSRVGRITPRATEESVRRMRGGRLQGEILVAMEVLSEEDVSQALREQAEEKLYEVFSWTDGSFRFEFGATLSKASGLARRSPANLILKGVRKRVPIDTVDGYLRENRRAALTRARTPFYRFQEVDLDREQRAWVEALDGTQRVESFLEAEEDRRRVLYALLTTGLVELQDAPPESAAAPKRPRRGPRPQARPRPEPAPPRDEASARREAAELAELAALAERFEGQNFFGILEIDEQAAPEEAEAAYERLAELAHPDRVASSSEAVRTLAGRVFDQVERAYRTLSDPRQRQLYLLDRKRAHREAAAQEEERRALQALQHFQRGDAALQQRDYETALMLFGRALELHPEDGDYHAHYGWALHLCHPDNLEMAQEAIEHVRRGIKLASDREKPYLFMGRLCKATGRPGAAEKMFTRAVRLQPNCVEALRELRLINMRRRKHKGFIGRILRR